MTSKFEQLIEYVINDEEQKARELFHDIVVEKSREIYENLMQEESEEELDEAKDEEELDEGAEEELDEAKDEEELDEGMHDEMDETMGGDASEQFMDEVEVEEEGMMEEEGGEDLEDRVVDLEDKLDELMAEFEALMADEKEEGHDIADMDNDGDLDIEDDSDFGAEGGDELEQDDTEEFELAEGVDLKAAPAPVKSEEGSINKKNVVANNSGAAGMQGKPVHATGGEEKGRPAPTTKDLISDFQNKAGAGMKDQKAAPKPVTTQAAGVNARTPFPKG